MSVQLLDKTRKINKLLHNNNSSKVVFTDICEVLTEILASNVLVVSKKGKVDVIMDVRIIRNVILCHGRSRQKKNVRNAEVIW